MITPRRLFLVDGLGALLSAFMLGVVLVRFERTIGMPAETLYGLAAIAGVLCLYSLACSMLDIKHWRGGLRLIACANLLYCCLTLGAMFCLHQHLSLLGFAYFAGEILVIVTLATLELRLASRPS